jgi:hypothetical protein
MAAALGAGGSVFAPMLRDWGLCGWLRRDELAVFGAVAGAALGAAAGAAWAGVWLQAVRAGLVWVVTPAAVPVLRAVLVGAMVVAAVCLVVIAGVLVF